jgi:hypothetical protein
MDRRRLALSAHDPGSFRGILFGRNAQMEQKF